MPFTAHCVTQLNAAIMSRLSDSRFTKGGVFGLAELMRREGESIPAVVSNDGQGEFTGFQSNESIVIYHRAIGLTNTLTAATSFGDGDTTCTDTVRMRCVVFTERERVKMNSADLASVFASAMRGVISAPDSDGFKSASTDSISADLDPLSVFVTEYQMNADKCPVHNGHLYFAINYALQINYDTSCITDCTTC